MTSTLRLFGTLKKLLALSTLRSGTHYLKSFICLYKYTLSLQKGLLIAHTKRIDFIKLLVSKIKFKRIQGQFNRVNKTESKCPRKAKFRKPTNTEKEKK